VSSSPNLPGRRAASGKAATLRDVMAVQATVPVRLHALRALELRPDYPSLPPVTGPARGGAAAPERPALGHGRAYAKWRAEVKRALARTRLPSRR
jgi:hypothetical protein